MEEALEDPRETDPPGLLEASPRPSSPSSLHSAGKPELQSDQKVLSLNSEPGQHILHRTPGHSASPSVWTVSDQAPSLQC